LRDLGRTTSKTVAGVDRVKRKIEEEGKASSKGKA
jgi:hypothetical protein